MVDRLRFLLDRPLDPSAAWAIVAFSGAIFLGVAALFVLAGSEPTSAISQEDRPAATSPSAPLAPVEAVGGEAIGHRPPPRRQDPQDVEGSAAARRAGLALRSHRALQHVPYRSGELAVDLSGARGHRAVLRVSASTTQAARRGWRRFLHRFGDSGRAYIPVYTARGRDG